MTTGSAIEDLIFEPGNIHHDHARDEQRIAHGKAARRQTPRSRQAELDLRGRPDPIALFEEQARARVSELVPIRHGRMMVSPFAFFRGAAAVMAADLARTPNSGLRAQLCGDAHLANFGIFGTPERELIFDVDDFDETHLGPWEWDLKRLAASIEIAGRAKGYSKRRRQRIVFDAARCYRETMTELAAMGNLDVWYARLDVEAALAQFTKRLTRRQRKSGAKLVTTAELQDSVRELGKLTRGTNGVRHLISRPPLIVPMGELLAERDRVTFEARIRAMLVDYARTLSPDRRVLLSQYRLVETARKVVGVGSVGTRCWIAMFAGVDSDDPLFLQIKEAEASVLERFVGPNGFSQHGERVVAGQHLMQASSDLLLGWMRTVGIDGMERDFYVRQLRDWKASIDVEQLLPEGMMLFGRMCGWTLARAHARSGDRVAIAGYLGTSQRFDEAIVAFAEAYADQNDRDYERFVQAIRAGRLSATAAA